MKSAKLCQIWMGSSFMKMLGPDQEAEEVCQECCRQACCVSAAAATVQLSSGLHNLLLAPVLPQFKAIRWSLCA